MFPDHFDNDWRAGSRERVFEAIARLQPGVTEIHVQPAIDTPEVRALGDVAAGWVDDLDLVTNDAEFTAAVRDSGAVLMLAHMNAESLARTLATGEVWYWSRSRGELWHKGATSGQIQTLVEMRVDCDQDALLLRVRVGGDGGCCHTGRRDCFYRGVAYDAESGAVTLVPRAS